MTKPITITLRDDDSEVRPGNAAVIEPAVPAVLDALTVACRSLYLVQGEGAKLVDDPVQLFEKVRGRPNAIRTWAGIAPRLRRELKAAGHPVRVVDERFVAEEFQPDRSAHVKLDSMTQIGFARAADELFGRFMVEDVDRGWWAGQLARLFPKASVVVAAATKRDVGQIVDELNDRFHIPARRRNGPHPSSGPARVVVTPHASVAAFAAQGPLMLILVDAHRAVADANFYGVQRVLQFARRTYGLIPAGFALDPLTAARLNEVTGDLLDCDVYRGRPPEVTVRFARSAGGRVRQTVDARSRNETAYWNNKQRNQRVVELAKAITTGDEEALIRFGFNGSALVTLGCDRVAVVAGSVDQAEHLADRLGWPMRTAIPGFQSPLTRKRKVVVTAVYAEENNLDANCIIRADGGYGLLAVPMLTRQQTKGEIVTVVDLDDRFDPRARDDTRRRMDGYRRQGFRVIPETRTETVAAQRA